MKIYYFNATHWDREWYYPKEAFRTYLVEMTDGMLKLLDDPENLPQFVFDGQTIVLEDVLEIHPEWRARLEKAISGGQLKVGPWYVMPDEFLVSGEALLRNLSLGRKIAESFGHAPWNVGYVCDIFGHIAQLPQILKGYGMQGATLWRGVPSETGPYLLWSAPDGSTVRTIHYHSKHGYSGITLRVRGTKPVPVDDEFKKRFLLWLSLAKQHWGKNIICSDAQDHAYPAPEMKKIRAILKECCPDAEIIHTDYTEVFEEEFKNGAELPHLFGELTYPAKLSGSGYQIFATLSSRYDIKHANDMAQNKLQFLLEPLTAFALVEDTKTDPAFLRYAWKHLLQNHAHDSICGCSPDIVHRHMHTRFEEVETVANQQLLELQYQDFEAVTQGSRWQILHAKGLDETDKIAALHDKNGNYALRIANPLPYEVDKVSEVEIAFPAHQAYPAEFAEPFTAEKFNLFRIYDESDAEVPYSIRAIRRKQDKILYPGTAAFFDLYTVVLRTKLRAAGWTHYSVKAVTEPVRRFATLRTGLRSASNGIIALEIASDGTYCVTDLRNQRSYPGQNDYRIDREIGDGWGHCSPHGTPVTTGGFCRAVRITHEGPERVEFEIIRTHEVAREIVYAGGVNAGYEGVRESSETVSLVIQTRVALDAGSDAVSVHTKIENNLRDARLQLVIPTGIAGNLFASQAFCFLERKPGRKLGNLTENFAEAEPLEKNFDGIVGKRDARGGLFFLATAGLHECGALAEAGDQLTVTFFRTFCRTVERNGEVEGELLRTLCFDYQLKCTAPECTFAELAHTRQILQAGSLPVSLIPQYLVKNAAAQSFVTLSGELAFSALKPAESGKPNEIIVRMVNLSDKPASGTLVFAKPFVKAELCRMDETVQSSLKSAENKVAVPATPWEVVTVKVTF